jgi:FHS family glucose/mannose:H+ symporter-like MFS transporter
MSLESNQNSVSTLKLMSSACAGMFVFGIVMAILGAILPSLFSKIQFNKGEAGNLFLYMNLAMLVMSLFFGPIVDRFGFKIFLIVCSLLVAASFFILSSAGTYSIVLLAVVILGFGGGGLNGGTNALTSDIHPEKRSSALNLLGIFFGFGALFIPFLIGTFLRLTSLEKILLFATFLSLIPLVLFSLFSFPKPKQAQGFPLSQTAKIIKNPLLWLCGFLLFFQSGNEFTLGGWISTYLQEFFKMSSMAASLILAGYWGAIMSGRLVSSRIVKFMKNEKLVLGSAILSFVAAIVIAASPSGVFASIGAVLIGLGFAAIYPTTLAVVGETFPAFSGTAFSVVFAVALCGGMTAPWLAGKIAQAHTLRQGLFIPVLNCGMIIILQMIIIKILRRMKHQRSNLNSTISKKEKMP